jgi:hypothetical protein
VYRWLWRGLWVLIPTLLLGRVFCNWMCPYGTLHQFFGWLFNIRGNRDNIARNAWRPVFQIKYYILTIMLVLAFFGSLQIGLLDPICLSPDSDRRLRPRLDFGGQPPRGSRQGSLTPTFLCGAGRAGRVSPGRGLWAHDHRLVE